MRVRFGRPEIMLLQLDDVLSPQLLTEVVSGLSRENVPRELGDIIMDGLRAHPLFMLGVQPRRFSAPVLRRLGAEERAPTTQAAMSGDVRADVCVTVFLSDPASYEGGELHVDTGFGEEPYRQGAGTCLVYPASARVRAASVTSGTAFVGELCVQSRIRDAERRQILYDVGCSRRFLEMFGGGRDVEATKLTNCEESLLRLWSEA